MYSKSPIALIMLVLILVSLIFFNGVTIEQENNVSWAAQPAMTPINPDELLPITSETVEHLEQTAMLRQGQMYGAKWLDQGQTLAISGSVGIWLYDRSTSFESPRLLSMKLGEAFSQAWSQDGTLLAIGARNESENFITLWNIATVTKRVLHERNGTTTDTFFAPAITSMAFDPGNHILVLGDDDGVLRFWDVQSGVETNVLQAHENLVSDLVFSPDGSILVSTSWDGNLRLWDVATNTDNFTLVRDERTLMGAEFDPSGTLLAFWSSGKLELLDIETKQIVMTQEGIFASNVSVSFSPDGKLMAFGGYGDETIKIIDLETNEVRSIAIEQAYSIFETFFHPDGNELVVVDNGGQIYLWDLERDAVLPIVSNFSGPVYDIEFSSDGNTLASAVSGKVQIWNVVNKTLLEDYKTYGDRTDNSISFNNDDTLFASLIPGGVLVWERGSYEEQTLISGYGLNANFSPDGTLLAYSDIVEGESYAIELWKVEEQTKDSRVFLGHTDMVISLDFSPDSTLLASGSADGTVRIWSLDDGELQATLEALPSDDPMMVFSRENDVNDLVFDPSGVLLAAAIGNGTILVWDVSNLSQIELKFTLESDNFRTERIAFSPDSSLLATPGQNSQGTIQIWDMNTGKQVALLTGHSAKVYSVAFNPAGTMLASASEDGTIRLWSRH